MTSNSNETQPNPKWYPPSNDIIFKLLWRKSIRLLMVFISIIIENISKEDLDSIRFTDTEQQISIDSKLTRLDIKVNTESGISINTEMQSYRQSAYIVRIVVYLAQSLLINNEGVKKYKDFKRTINLSVLKYNEFRDDKSIHHLGICDLESGNLCTSIMEIYIFEAKKAAEKDLADPLTAWGKFFASTTEEECMQAAKLDPYVAEAAKIVKFLNLDEKIRSLINEEELKKLDLIDSIEFAKDEAKEEGFQEGIQKGIQQGMEQGIQQGMEQGIQQGIQQGMEQGIQQGIQQGMEQGIQQGIQQGMQASHRDVWQAATINIIKGMLENNIPIELIAASTKLPIEKINNLKLSNNIDQVTKN